METRTQVKKGRSLLHALRAAKNNNPGEETGSAQSRQNFMPQIKHATFVKQQSFSMVLLLEKKHYGAI